MHLYNYFFTANIRRKNKNFANKVSKQDDSHELLVNSHSDGILFIDESQIKVGNRLGSGQFSEVFQGVYNSNDIALKVLSFLFLLKLKSYNTKTHLKKEIKR